ncbi:MAG TPA: VOC family protein [Thermoanaerobaculia bacterium]|nr:VOC family protein [Thermoanaerobaculia bacterium]
METTKHEPGTFCWVELATSDGSAAKKFYTSLFGLSTKDNPMGEGGVYTMLQKNGKDAAGLYEMGPEQKGMPPNWGSYVAVENANDAAAHAKELGATVMMEPFDVMEHGRMAVIQDPTGAVVSFWEPKSHVGARVVNEPGSFCWNELYTADPARAADFYTGLFGWTKDVRPMEHGDYVIFSFGDRMAAGMMKIPKEWGPIPPHWTVYFAVDDCDRTVEKAKGLGANVTVPPTDIPEVGRFAMLTDPQGAGFAVIKLEMPAA